MTIKKIAEDWFSVYYRGSVIADFGSAAAAEKYVRRNGHFVVYS